MSFPMTVGRYELLQLLGEGNFALVYKARQIQTKQIVAVKKMKKLNKQDVQMVKKEIEIMKDLKHKNIVEYITDFRQRQNGDWYIVLEYCGKGDMQKYKKKVGKVPQAHCKLFVRNILEALVELHKRKIAHRDLKLANILINDDYKLKLADFGFSKDYQMGYMRSFCGTPLSMAPEILKRQSYNEKCDVWSLGVLTFMMLYNKPPFFPTRTEGMGIPGITNAVTLRNHKFDDSIQVSETCKEFINACLQKQASKRPSTKQLLNHEWFAEITNSNVSALRVDAMKVSFKQKDPLKQQATKICEQMLFGVFQTHLKKLSQTMLINIDVITKLQHIFVDYYPTQTKIIECYFLVVLKKLQELASREVIYVLGDSSYKIKLRELKKFKDFETQIANYVDTKLVQKSIVETTKINIEKEIIKFCLNQTELLIDCMNDEEIHEKLFLLKSLCKFVTTDYQPSMVDIKWGDRKDMAKYVIYILEYFKSLNQEMITKVINHQPDSDEDLESTWLIQNHIRQNKVNKNLETELGKLALYVLNIPTNFSSDKFEQTQKIQLDQESWIEWMKSYD